MDKLKTLFPNVDRSEVAAGVAAALVVFAPLIHKTGVDKLLNLDLTNTTILVVLAIGVAGYFLHRGQKAA